MTYIFLISFIVFAILAVAIYRKSKTRNGLGFCIVVAGLSLINLIFSVGIIK